MTLLLSLFLACGEKESEETDTSPSEQVEDTTEEAQPADEETSEETQDTGTSETTEDATFKTNRELGVCEDEGENS